MAGWPKYWPGQTGYSGPALPHLGQPEVSPAYATGPTLFPDQGYYGGNPVGPVNTDYYMNGPGQQYYPYHQHAAPPPPPPLNPATHYSFPSEDYGPIPSSVDFTPVAAPVPPPSYPPSAFPAPVPPPPPPLSAAPVPPPPPSQAAKSNLLTPTPQPLSLTDYSAIPPAKREAEMIEFWKNRCEKLKPGAKPFPFKFALRLVVGMDKRAVEALEVLFKEADKSGLVFEEDPPSKKNVPENLKCMARCRWDPKQKWIVGYGATLVDAKNEAAVNALKEILGEEEYGLMVEMNRPERFISLDAQKLSQTLNQYALAMIGPVQEPQAKRRKTSESTFPFEYKDNAEESANTTWKPGSKSSKTEYVDSDYSVGGSEGELTGDEEDESRMLPMTLKLIRLRKDLYVRENRIIRYWLSKRPPEPDSKVFPNIFRLRSNRNIHLRGRSSVNILFQSFPKHQRPIFQSAPNPKPELGYFHVRCSWDNFKQNIHGYGNTPETAENDAGIQALIKILGEEEYRKVVEMTKDDLYDGLDLNRIRAHLVYKKKIMFIKPPSFDRSILYPHPAHTFEAELVNYPKTLEKFPMPGTTTSVPKTQFKIQSRKLRHYGKAEIQELNTVDKIPPFQLFDKLLSIENIQENAVAALGSLFAELLEPTPSYTAIQYAGKFKVECVTRGKYFVEEASTEESAKNSAALVALKFLVGEEALENIFRMSAEKNKKATD